MSLTVYVKGLSAGPEGVAMDIQGSETMEEVKGKVAGVLGLDVKDFDIVHEGEVVEGGVRVDDLSVCEGDAVVVRESKRFMAREKLKAKGFTEFGVNQTLKVVESDTASEEEKIEIINLLADYNPLAVTATHDNIFAKAPIHLSVIRGYQNLTKALLSHGADVNTLDNHNRTPLYWAALRGHDDVATILLSHGADHSLKSKDGQTPLHRAAEGGNLTMLNILLDAGADPNVKDNDGAKPSDKALSSAPAKALLVEREA
eukprot:TRINITY_DN40797_c0_g1_i1.p1 TRINITY_DN40797_c0_g1~~TRINITY_DN40797_c0_g1_i1.p1  ORF type:complete len:258 (+),score=81.83 TRINITY_DN40797_c0_g1_i1:102-875(+)